MLPKQGRLGNWGEAVAARVLEAQGYEIIEQNWRCEAGELDLVTRDGEVWVFVEVKTRRSEEYGMPEEAVTPAKRGRLLMLGEAYLAEHGLDHVAWRIDVVAILADREGTVRRLDIYRNAVETI